jgi:6-pyruvoyltetrahydropterin/6-carboxytetrahydropterin synthase
MVRFVIKKDFEFSASHRLEGLPPDHQCARLHGHNYVVRVQLASKELIKPGFVRDYGDLKEFKIYLDKTFDHRHVNDVLNTNPTAEHMAAHFLGWLQMNGFEEAEAVGVSETPKTWAWAILDDNADIESV